MGGYGSTPDLDEAEPLGYGSVERKSPMHHHIGAHDDLWPGRISPFMGPHARWVDVRSW